MLSPKQLFDWLADGGVGFYAGVPDSLLKDFCAYVTDHTSGARHVITANEGSAVAMAMGYHLATGGMGAVYLQNSGLGNLINPLTSLVMTYQLPILTFTSLRGWPDPATDEPQHAVMGPATPGLLDSVDTPHHTLYAQDGVEEFSTVLEKAEKDLYRQFRHLVEVTARLKPLPQEKAERFLRAQKRRAKAAEKKAQESLQPVPAEAPPPPAPRKRPARKKRETAKR